MIFPSNAGVCHSTGRSQKEGLPFAVMLVTMTACRGRDPGRPLCRTGV